MQGQVSSDPEMTPANSNECVRLRSLLSESVGRNRTRAILLSGGVDSTILASLLRPELAITVVGGDNAPDLEYSRLAAELFSSNYVVITLDFDSLPALIEAVISTMMTFDPIEIRNSVVTLAGIKQSKRSGYNSVMTGDGGDELFAGYNYLSRYYGDKVRLQEELVRLWSIMRFSSIPLGAAEEVRIATPFLDPKFSDYAKSLPVEKKIGMFEGKVWGKYILRQCFEPSIKRLAWREKMAQEEGSGSNSLIKSFVDKAITDSELKIGVEAAARQHVKLRDKEQLYYYHIFLKHFEPPLEQTRRPELHMYCPQCHGYFESPRKYCTMCGAYPISPAVDPL